MMKYSRKSFLAYNFQSIINDDLVRCIYQDSQNNYWFGLASGGAVRLDDTEYTAYSVEEYPGISNVRSIVEFEKDELLLVSLNGLYLFNGKTMRRLDYDLSLQNYLYSDALLDNDTLWVASINLGAIKIYKGETQKVTVYQQRLE